MLRTEKLTVRDEIENALSYYRPLFSTELPRLYAELKEAARSAVGAFLPDGKLDRRRPRRQPEFDATTLVMAVRRHAEKAPPTI